MKKSLLLPLLVTTFTVGAVASGTYNANVAKADAGGPNSVVGAWQVDAIGAPFVPHQFTYNADGTMLTTNPTDVQENPSRPHGGTHDSLGMGPWEPVNGQPGAFVGTFYELNANVDDNTPTDTLSVTYKIVVDGDHFTGNAIAKQGSFSGPATLNGTRLTIDESALAGL